MHMSISGYEVSLFTELQRNKSNKFQRETSMFWPASQGKSPQGQVLDREYTSVADVVSGPNGLEWLPRWWSLFQVDTKLGRDGSRWRSHWFLAAVNP